MRGGKGSSRPVGQGSGAGPVGQGAGAVLGVCFWVGAVVRFSVAHPAPPVSVRVSLVSPVVTGWLTGPRFLPPPPPGLFDSCPGRLFSEEPLLVLRLGRGVGEHFIGSALPRGPRVLHQKWELARVPSKRSVLVPTCCLRLRWPPRATAYTGGTSPALPRLGLAAHVLPQRSLRASGQIGGCEGGTPACSEASGQCPLFSRQSGALAVAGPGTGGHSAGSWSEVSVLWALPWNETQTWPCSSLPFTGFPRRPAVAGRGRQAPAGLLPLVVSLVNSQVLRPCLRRPAPCRPWC